MPRRILSSFILWYPVVIFPRSSKWSAPKTNFEPVCCMDFSIPSFFTHAFARHSIRIQALSKLSFIIFNILPFSSAVRYIDNPSMIKSIFPRTFTSFDHAGSSAEIPIVETRPDSSKIWLRIAIVSGRSRLYQVILPLSMR